MELSQLFVMLHILGYLILRRKRARKRSFLVPFFIFGVAEVMNGDEDTIDDGGCSLTETPFLDMGLARGARGDGGSRVLFFGDDIFAHA